MYKLHWTLLSGLLIIVVAIGLGRFAYTPMLPIMIKQTALDLKTGGYIASMNYLGYTFGALTPLFWKTDHSRVQMLRLGTLLTLLAFMGLSIETSPRLQPISWGFFRLVNGLGSGWIFINTSGLILERLHRANKLNLIGVIYSGVGIGGLLSGLVILLADEHFGLTWQMDWRLLALIALLLSLPGLFLLKELPDQPLNEKNNKEKNIHNQKTWTLAAIYFCQGFSYVIVVTFLPLITEHLGDWSNKSWLILSSIAIPSTVIWGLISHKIGNLTTLKLAYSLQLIGLISPVLFPNALGAILCSVLVGFTFMGIVTLVIAQARIINPGNATIVIALVTTCYSVGQVIGPSFAGFMAQKSGSFSIPLLMGGGLLGLGILLLFRLRRIT